MEVIKLNARSRDAAESALNLYLDQCKNSTMLRSQRALVVDGKTLIYILDKRANIQDLFLSLTKMCSSVLACRATPLQVRRTIDFGSDGIQSETNQRARAHSEFCFRKPT